MVPTGQRQKHEDAAHHSSTTTASPCGTRQRPCSFTKQSPSHATLAELSQACKKVGIKFGLCFSSIDWGLTREPLAERQYAGRRGLHGVHIHAQLTELLRRRKYGRSPNSGTAMGKPSPAQSDQLRAWAHELQPNTHDQLSRRQRPGRLRSRLGQLSRCNRGADPGPLGIGGLHLHKTWGYANWDDLTRRIQDTSCGLLRGRLGPR